MTDPLRIENELKRRTRLRRLVHVESCESTQDLAAAAAASEYGETGQVDTLFWADHQRAGRGRRQRHWHDEPGRDLAVTFLVTQRLPQPLTLPAALPAAVLLACEPFAGRELRIKWPNDVYCGDRKLCGVLVDRDSRRPDTFRIGVGINVNRENFPPELHDIGTSLALLAGHHHDREALLLALAQQVDDMLTALQSPAEHAYARLEQCFRQRLGLVGQQVHVEAGESLHGTMTAIDLQQLTLDGTTDVPLAIVRALH